MGMLPPAHNRSARPPTPSATHWPRLVPRTGSAVFPCRPLRPWREHSGKSHAKDAKDAKEVTRDPAVPAHRLAITVSNSMSINPRWPWWRDARFQSVTTRAWGRPPIGHRAGSPTVCAKASTHAAPEASQISLVLEFCVAHSAQPPATARSLNTPPPHEDAPAGKWAGHLSQELAAAEGGGGGWGRGLRIVHG